MERAVAVRRAQFADTRACARKALSELTGCDHSSTGIVRGERGVPVFPEGVVGSLTHTTDFRAAVVADGTLFASVGLDVEVAQPLPSGVGEVVLTARDRDQVGVVMGRCGTGSGLSCSDSDVNALVGTVIFSAKESVYKSWFPVVGVFLDFSQAVIELRCDGSFVAHIDSDVGVVPRLPTIEGRWAIVAGYVVTGTWVV